MAIDSSGRLSDLTIGVLGNVVFAFGVWLAAKAGGAIERRNPTARRALLLVVGLTFVALNLVVDAFFRESSPWTLVISSLLFGWLIRRELNQFWRIGLVGTDGSVSGGLDYRRSLKLCTNSLDFLGIGAAKLTQEGAVFDAAIARCHRDNRPIRFLLCSPNSGELVRLAQQAGRPRTEYRQRVLTSLIVLRRLKIEQQRNIEVSFYDEMPLFRLMFIDDRLCLASHYVLGEGDGSQLPQLHVRNAEPPKRDLETLYYPLRRYFDQLWESASAWNFEEPA